MPMNVQTHITCPVNDCNTLQRTAKHCNTQQFTATHCNTLQNTATHSNSQQHPATHCNIFQQCNTLHNTAPHRNKMHHTATHCKTHDPHNRCQWTSRHTSRVFLRNSRSSKESLCWFPRLLFSSHKISPDPLFVISLFSFSWEISGSPSGIWQGGSWKWTRFWTPGLASWFSCGTWAPFFAPSGFFVWGVRREASRSRTVSPSTARLRMILSFRCLLIKTVLIIIRVSSVTSH